jgi:hypothetical protein
MDDVAQALEATSEVSGYTFLPQVIEIAFAEVSVSLAGGEHVIGGGENLVGNGHGGALAPAACFETKELVPEISCPVALGRPCSCQRSADSPGRPRPMPPGGERCETRPYQLPAQQLSPQQRWHLLPEFGLGARAPLGRGRAVPRSVGRVPQCRRQHCGDDVAALRAEDGDAPQLAPPMPEPELRAWGRRRPRANSAICSGLSSPWMIASNISPPETPNTSLATLASLMLAHSRSLSRRPASSTRQCFPCPRG